MNFKIRISSAIILICLVIGAIGIERASSSYENRVEVKRFAEKGKTEESKVEGEIEKGTNKDFADFLINFGVVFEVLKRTTLEVSKQNVSKAELFSDPKFHQLFIQWIQVENQEQNDKFGHKKFSFYEYLSYGIEYAYDAYNLVDTCKVDDVVVSHSPPASSPTITTTFISTITNATFTTTHSIITAEEKRIILENIEELKKLILDPKITESSNEKGFEGLAKNVLVLLIKCLLRCMNLDEELYEHLFYFINLL